MSRRKLGASKAGVGTPRRKAYQADRTVCLRNNHVSRETSGRTERRPVCLELREVYIERKICFLEKNHTIISSYGIVRLP